jgi:hypothetical protein
LNAKILATTHPVVVAGDFNLVRSPLDKSNLVINNPRLMDEFNDWVAELELVELHRVGARFTWTNNQNGLVRSVLDRVFVSGH